MDINYLCRCSQGCRNCPRMRGCLSGAAVPANAEIPSLEPSVPLDSGAAEPVPVSPSAAEPVPVSPVPDEPVQPGTALPQNAPQSGGVGLPALDTPEDTVPSAPNSAPNSAMDEYLEKYCEQGILRIQAFRGQQAIPVEGVHVTVRCPIGGDQMVFFEGSTDSSGIIDPILLPAPKPETSLSPDLSDPCSEYEIIAEHPDFETLTSNVMVFPGVKTIQPLQMRLKAV